MGVVREDGGFLVPVRCGSTNYAVGRGHSTSSEDQLAPPKAFLIIRFLISYQVNSAECQVIARN